MNTTILANARNLKTSASLPLFSAADRARVRALPLPARRLACRLGMPPSTALLIAEAAGFRLGLEVGR